MVSDDARGGKAGFQCDTPDMPFSGWRFASCLTPANQPVPVADMRRVIMVGGTDLDLAQYTVMAADKDARGAVSQVCGWTRSDWHRLRLA